jgi:hypothetical protein
MRTLPSGDRLARMIAILIGFTALIALLPGPAMCTVHVVSADYYFSDCASVKAPLYAVLASGILLGIVALVMMSRGAAAAKERAPRPHWTWLVVPALIALVLAGWDAVGLRQIVPGPCDLAGPCVPARVGQVVEWRPGLLGWPPDAQPGSQSGSVPGPPGRPSPAAEIG